ncbi:hypothetical protein GCM10022415_00410 [Knoellia locipacati]|uniref:histidine kinase n=1 Tax=Knoellia locipacati TaxID=882824 RepID=A0A512SVL0_9MICO|nr:hypothetical protein KLO01_00410 [Knoellia locipacati]
MGTAAAVLAGVATATVQLSTDSDLLTTHAAVGPAAGAVQVVASLALVGAGLVVWFGGGRGSPGVAVLGAAVAFMAPVWIGWQDAPPWVQSLGALIAPLLLPCLIDVATSFSTGADGGDRPHRRSGLVRVAYVVTVVHVVLRATLHDPFLDPNCWADCRADTLLVHPAPDAVAVLDLLWSAAALLLGAGLVLSSTVTVARRSSAAVLDVGVVVTATAAVSVQVARAMLSPGAEDPRREVLQLLFVVEGVTLVLLACALARFTWCREQHRASLRRLADVASEAAGIESLATALSRATGLSDLELGYWVPAAAGHVDAAGRPMPPDPHGRDVSVLRGDAPVAVIRSHEDHASMALIGEALGPAARLALDNERLRVEEVYHVQQLADSRARIVSASDRARRELERDLHDGAQQSLLAVLYSLQVAAAASRNRGDDAQTRALEGSVDACRAVLAELREIAHGLFPVILDTGGLAAALENLGDRSGLVVTVQDRTVAPLPKPVAHAGYLAAAAAVAAATDCGHSRVDIRLHHTAGELVVEVYGAPAGAYVQTHDRVGALGGHLVRDDENLRVVIPCE